MNETVKKSQQPHLVWVSWSHLEKLDAATWLEVTRELRQLEWRVTLIAPGATGTQQIDGVDVVCLHRPNIYFLWQLVYHPGVLLFLARRWRDIDVVMFHQMSAPWLLPLRMVRGLTRRHRPLVVMDTRTMHMEPKQKQTMRQRLNGWFHSLMICLARFLADGQTAITKRMAEGVRIPSRQLLGVWPSGVNPDRFALAGRTRRWPDGDDTIRLVYIGCLHRARNLMALSRAVKAANTQGMKFTLSMIGSGTESAELAEFANRCDGFITVTPPVPHHQIPEHLRSCHVGVLPFPDEEKFRVSSPIKLFEYMAAGMPIFLTRIDCHTDVVGQGDFAYWAEDASVEGLLAGLRRMWDDRESLAIRGREASVASLAWTWKASAEKLKAALEVGLARAGTMGRDVSCSDARTTDDALPGCGCRPPSPALDADFSPARRTCDHLPQTDLGQHNIETAELPRGAPTSSLD